MKLWKIFVNALLSVFAMLLAPAFAETEGTIQQEYSDQCLISFVFNDQEKLAETIADPTKFMQLVVLISNPETAQAAMGCSNPERWKVLVSNMSNPAKMMNMMAIFMNPAVYMNWMMAATNPQTFQPFFAFMNPIFYMQWMTASMNPVSYQAPILAQVSDRTTQ